MAEAIVSQEQIQLDKMAYRSVLKPILSQLDSEGVGTGRVESSGSALLSEALEVAESYYPGLSSYLVEGILIKAGCRQDINMLAAYLLLEREEKMVRRKPGNPLFRETENRCLRFKMALGSIPLRVQDVTAYNLFMNQEVARPMAKLLEALSAVISECPMTHMKIQELKQMKLDFVSHAKQLVMRSRAYANERDRQQAIYLVANKLVHITNIILDALE